MFGLAFFLREKLTLLFKSDSKNIYNDKEDDKCCSIEIMENSYHSFPQK